MQRSGAHRCRVADRQCSSFISCFMWVQLPLLQPLMLRVAQMVRAPGCGPGGRRFEAGHAPHGFLAQLVERQTEDLRVPGPIPGEPTTYGRMPESGQMGRTVNPLPHGCVGSNPTSPTIRDAYGIAMCVSFLYTEKGNLYVVKTSACFVLFFP